LKGRTEGKSLDPREVIKVGSGVNYVRRNFKIRTLFPVLLEQLIQMHAAQIGEPNTVRILDGKILGG
jgi:hypothetical protein